MPDVVDACEAQFTGLALDDEAAFDIVEQPHPFRVERMRAHEASTKRMRAPCPYRAVACATVGASISTPIALAACAPSNAVP